MTEGYKLLAAAIIKQCLLDYRKALQYIKSRSNITLEEVADYAGTDE